LERQVNNFSGGWQPRLFSSDQMSRLSVQDPEGADWRVVAYRDLTSRVAHEHFPCPFAQKSLQRSSQWFTYLESLELAQLERLRITLLDYLHISQRALGKHRVLLPLAVLVRPERSLRPLAEYHQRGWAVLQYLHDHDVAAWPSEVPKDPEHYLWSFCFGGVQLFVNFSSPAHEERRSRNLGPSMAFVINPRKNFDVVAGNTPEGDAVRRRVRARIAIHDQRSHSKDLGSYGDPENHEWRQYAATESGASLPPSCPLRIGGHAA
jgi:FPC/CPF motif-containing protein YcgG